MDGRMGKLLFVNLSNGDYWVEKPSEEIYRNFIGGDGLGVRILYEKMKAGVDPLGPDNILGFLAGPLPGTKFPGGGRFSVVAKSPLTGGWGDSNCGGRLAPALKRTGYDGIFILGTAEKPVYLYVDDRAVEIRDAEYLWGKTTKDAEKMLIDELGKQVRIATIGPSGENLSLIASIMHDFGRAAGRSGLGAVMGSKKLKALVVSGEQKVTIGNMERYESLISGLRESLRKEPTRLVTVLKKYGTASAVNRFNIEQDTPSYNWKGLSEEVFPLKKAEAINGESYEKFKKRKYACTQCSIACGAILEYADKDGNKFECHRPEYETIAAFGPLCLSNDQDMIIKASEKCNLMGFDTISAGCTIAFAMECFEQGVITLDDTDGLDLSFGNSEAILTLLDLMSKREGIGAVFADGVKKASEKIGDACKEYAIHVGGQEPPMHDPRCWPGFASYAIDPTPGRHTRSGLGLLEHGWKTANVEKWVDQNKMIANKYDISAKKGQVMTILDNWLHFVNATGLCIFHEYGCKSYPTAEAVACLFGWNDFDREEALIVGERIHTLRHCFNVREGITSWKMPRRIMGDPPFTKGPTANFTLDIDLIKQAYYEAMDWDIDSGKPSRTKLEKLGLSNLVVDLK